MVMQNPRDFVKIRNMPILCVVITVAMVMVLRDSAPYEIIFMTMCVV
jgi:hypothetical protein